MRVKNNNLEVFQSKFYEFFDLDIKDQNGISNTSVYMGYTYPIDAQDFVIYFMDWWVDLVDHVLDNHLDKWNIDYALKFTQRGFTLNEFKSVMSGRIKEQYFEHERAFEYLYIEDKHAQDIFISTNNDEEKDIVAKYLNAIKKSLKYEISDLTYFFITGKMHLYLPIDSYEKHVHILAKSGGGKSELIKLMVYDLQRKSAETRNKSIIVIAPEADLPTEVLQFSLNEGEEKDRVIFLDPFIKRTANRLLGETFIKEEYKFCVNPFDLSNKSEESINVYTQYLAKAFFEIFRDESNLSATMKPLIKGCINTLLRLDGTSIDELKRFLDDSENEDLINAGKQNPNKYIREEMVKMKGNSRIAATKSSLNSKLYDLLVDKVFANLLVGYKTIDIEKEINSGKVIICNLSKNKMGDDSATAFGKLFVALIQSAVQQREDISKELRKQTYLFIDEFQNYVNPSMKKLMAEVRKFKLSLILSHQIWGQEMTKKVQDIVSGNTSLKIGGESDATTRQELGKILKGVRPKDFDDLPRYSFFVYDSNHKKSGTKILKVPDYLVKVKVPFYMDKNALKEYFSWLVYESGFYVKSNKVDDLKTKQSSFSDKQEVDKTIYKPNFDD